MIQIFSLGTGVDINALPYPPAAGRPQPVVDSLDSQRASQPNRERPLSTFEPLNKAPNSKGPGTTPPRCYALEQLTTAERPGLPRPCSVRIIGNRAMCKGCRGKGGSQVQDGECGRDQVFQRKSTIFGGRARCPAATNGYVDLCWPKDKLLAFSSPVRTSEPINLTVLIPSMSSDSPRTNAQDS